MNAWVLPLSVQMNMDLDNLSEVIYREDLLHLGLSILFCLGATLAPKTTVTSH